MDNYRVKLDVYSGPLDLLLYLIRREEVDIHDIPIARITEQYCAYVETLKQLDPDLAGEFLVMAATLMEIKTRMLLPHPEGDQDEVEGFDPRAELVRQLLEYKAFKDAAGDLRAAAAVSALRFPRRPVPPEAAEPGKDIEEVQLWDLVDAFRKLMVAIGQNLRTAEIIYDDTPLELHAEDILDRLRREGNMSFQDIFAGRVNRSEVIGLFLALLELVRRRQVFVEQQQTFGEIHVYLNPDPPADLEPLGQAGPEKEQAATPDADSHRQAEGQAEETLERGSQTEATGS